MKFLELYKLFPNVSKFYILIPRLSIFCKLVPEISEFYMLVLELYEKLNSVPELLGWSKLVPEVSVLWQTLLSRDPSTAFSELCDPSSWLTSSFVQAFYCYCYCQSQKISLLPALCLPSLLSAIISGCAFYLCRLPLLASTWLFLVTFFRVVRLFIIVNQAIWYPFFWQIMCFLCFS